MDDAADLDSFLHKHPGRGRRSRIHHAAHLDRLLRAYALVERSRQHNSDVWTNRMARGLALEAALFAGLGVARDVIPLVLALTPIGVLVSLFYWVALSRQMKFAIAREARLRSLEIHLAAYGIDVATMDRRLASGDVISFPETDESVHLTWLERRASARAMEQAILLLLAVAWVIIPLILAFCR